MVVSTSHNWRAGSTLVVIAVLVMLPLAASAQLKVLISGGFSGPYEQLLPEFGLQPIIVEVAAANELENAIVEMVRQRAQA
jgi:hypothetical protein